MKKRYLLILAAASFALNCIGCAHAPATAALPPAASHVGVDQAVAAAKTSQQSAARQVAVIESKIADPATKQLVVDLHSTISDLGLKTGLRPTTRNISQARLIGERGRKSFYTL